MDQAKSFIHHHSDLNPHSRSLVLGLLQKPAWALTEKEAEEIQDADELGLIEFGKALDPDAILHNLQTSSDPPDMERDDDDQPAVEVDHSPQKSVDHSTPNFFSQPLHPPSVHISSDPNSSDRHVVVSADVVRNMPRLVSNLPYLRLCPSV